MRFSLIDDTSRGDHYFLEQTDACAFLHEYTSKAGFQSSIANNLISNLKKPIDRRGRPEYRYKQSAISTCIKLLSDAISNEWLGRGTLVPVPPSKAKDHPLYDDRILQVCQGVAAKVSPPADVRELVVCRETMRAAHESPDDRPKVPELIANYLIDERIAEPAPSAIAVVDDVLTNGTHFRAMSTVLLNRYPGVPIVGLFIARRVFATNSMIEGF